MSLIALRRAFLLAALFCVFLYAPVRGADLEKSQFNIGRHSGVLSLVTAHCPAWRVDTMLLALSATMFQINMKDPPPAFVGGFAQGRSEARRSIDKGGAETYCISIKMLYGPNGVHVKNAVKPKN